MTMPMRSTGTITARIIHTTARILSCTHTPIRTLIQPCILIADGFRILSNESLNSREGARG